MEQHMGGSQTAVTLRGEGQHNSLKYTGIYIKATCFWKLLELREEVNTRGNNEKRKHDKQTGIQAQASACAQSVMT